MKKYQYLVVCCLLLLFGCASARAQSLLWRLEHPAVKGHTSYVFGTMHLQTETAFRMGDSVLPALRSCSVFASEIEMDMEKLSPESLRDMMRLMAVKFEINPTAELDHTQRRELRALLGRMGKPYDSLRVSISLIEWMTSSVEMYGTPEFAVALDKALWDYAKKSRLRCMGLESIGEQLTALMTLNKESFIAMLSDDGSDAEEQVARLSELYLERRIDGFLEYTREMSESDPVFAAALLDKRNEVMAVRIDSIARGTSFFAAIGAAHLGGDGGVLEMLRARGWRVSPVTDPSRRVPEEFLYLRAK